MDLLIFLTLARDQNKYTLVCSKTPTSLTNLLILDNSYGDPSKAAEKLKFTAKVSFQEGLSLLLKSTTENSV